MSTALTIGGSAITLSALNSFPVGMSLSFREISTLTIARRGGALAGLPDPWLGKTCSLSVGGTVVFQGNVTDADPTYTNIGWVTCYQCRCLRNRGDRVPVTDPNTLTDTSAFNLQPDDLTYVASRAGRTVGQILTAVLTGVVNATALDAKGIGGYTSLSPPTLPSATVADLAALTLVPPAPVYIQGEKLLAAIEGFCSQWAPNLAFWIDQATGNLRFTSLIGLTNHTFTMDSDRVQPTPLRRSVGDSYQRVVVRGQPMTEPALLTLSSGGLAEDFAYGALSNAAAKAAYVPDDFDQDKLARSEGSCTCTDTLNVVVNPDDNTQAWAANYWDQTSTGKQGNAFFYYSGGSGLTQFVSRRIVSNASLSASGTSNLVLDRALPATNFNHFAIYGLSSGSSLVYRKYKVVDSAQAAAMARVFTYPVGYVGVNGDTATLTSAPMGSVCWSANGLPPYAEYPMAFTFDPGSGSIIFSQSLYVFLGNKAPSDVRVLLAINTGSLTAIKPTSGYAGTSNTVEGMTDTLTVTCDGWRDPINQASMEVFAQDLLDSVKDTVVEGEITYLGLYSAGLTFGGAASVTGTGYTTGWESLAIPILETSLEWNSGEGTHYTTTMHCSNRRSHYTSGEFLRPERVAGTTFGGDDTYIMRGGLLGEVSSGQLDIGIAANNSTLNPLTSGLQGAADVMGGANLDVTDIMGGARGEAKDVLRGANSDASKLLRGEPL